MSIILKSFKINNNSPQQKQHQSASNICGHFRKSTKERWKDEKKERICHIVKSLDAKVVMINVMIVPVHLTIMMTKGNASNAIEIIVIRQGKII